MDVFIPDPEASVAVFADRSGDRQLLWVSTGIGFVVASLGVIFLGLAAGFRSHSVVCVRMMLVCGVILVLLGFSTLFLFVSSTSFIIDERARVVVLEQRWLYAQTRETLPFDDVARINLRLRRTRLEGGGEGCMIGKGLSLVRHDRTWMDIPFRQDEIGRTLAATADLPLNVSETREC
ncbi:MAG: hypothetical protein OXL97_05735 [Chloroflexota bacterium]|nr:hypothetical protein [Chloroflexota bacterium]MDE2885362.1 hypothetical protein [Chloroflexota bacterium]